jgi:hypothetical protein
VLCSSTKSTLECVWFEEEDRFDTCLQLISLLPLERTRLTCLPYVRPWFITSAHRSSSDVTGNHIIRILWARTDKPLPVLRKRPRAGCMIFAANKYGFRSTGSVILLPGPEWTFIFGICVLPEKKRLYATCTGCPVQSQKKKMTTQTNYARTFLFLGQIITLLP